MAARAVVALVVLGACSFGSDPVVVDEVDAGGGTSIESRVSGVVWREGPVAETVVIASDASGEITRTRTDEQGRFVLPLGALSGVVELSGDGLRQRIDIDAVGDTVNDVLVSPVGTLAEAYIDSPVLGTRSEKTEIVADFFQISITGTNLLGFDAELGSTCADLDSVEIGPPALAGLLQAGIRYLGQAMLSQGSGSGRADDLLDALVQDLEADGFFDGIGRDGRPLQFAGVPLDAFTLRSAYINALTAFLRSGRNASGFDASCFKRFFDEMLLSRSPLFPSSTWINAPFETGCASCTQLENGDFACTAGDCGPCGRCNVDFSGETPVAACEPVDAECPGNCDQCVPTAEDGNKFECVAESGVCSGNCASCSADGNGGFSCQANAEQCVGNCGACVGNAEDDTVFSCEAQPMACPGNCNQCQPVAGDVPGFACVATPSVCGGDCSSCGDDGTGGLSCQADTNKCVGSCGACVGSAEDATAFSCAPQPSACPGNCNQCQPVAGEVPGFACEATPSSCSGDCASCADDGNGGFSCQGSLAACPGPTDGSARCNVCQAMGETEFVCIDQTSQCPATTETPITSCNSASICSLSGTRLVEVSSYQCLSGVCSESLATEERGCSRQTDGIDCGTLRCTGSYTPCEQAGPQESCSFEGEQRRVCRQPICSAGECSGGREVVQRRDCEYDPRGEFCEERTCELSDGRQSVQRFCCMSVFPFACSVPCGVCEGEL